MKRAIVERLGEGSIRSQLLNGSAKSITMDLKLAHGTLVVLEDLKAWQSAGKAAKRRCHQFRQLTRYKTSGAALTNSKGMLMNSNLQLAELGCAGGSLLSSRRAMSLERDVVMSLALCFEYFE